VLDAPVNMLTGDTDEPSVEDTGETASGDVVDTTTQPLAQSDITAETATEAVAASSGDSAAAAAPGQQQGKFIVLSALESVYSEGMKMADSSLEASKKALNDIRRDVETSTALYQGLELGESLLASSLSVLETVGKNAVDVIVQERNKARQQQQQHGQPESPQQQQQQASPSVASPLVAVTPATTTTTAKAPGNGKRTFAKQFEDVGMGHLQALEMLASTADAKFHSLSNSATPEKLASAEKILKTLNFEHDEAEIEAAEELLLVLPAGSSHLVRGEKKPTFPFFNCNITKKKKKKGINHRATRPVCSRTQQRHARCRDQRCPPFPHCLANHITAKLCQRPRAGFSPRRQEARPQPERRVCEKCLVLFLTFDFPTK